MSIPLCFCNVQNTELTQIEPSEKYTAHSLHHNYPYALKAMMICPFLFDSKVVVFIARG